MAEIINIKNEAGEVQYPVTKPECVIDENGKSVLTLIQENGTELRQEIDELSERIDNLPKGDEFDAEGNYPLLHVGTADDLAGRGESVPAEFGFRASGGKSIKDGRAYIKAIKGNSVVWNQHIDFNNPVAFGTSSVSLENGEYILTLSGGSANAVRFPSAPFVQGRSMLLLCEYTSEESANNINMKFGAVDGAGSQGQTFQATKVNSIFTITSAIKEGKGAFWVWTSNASIIRIKSLRVIDLTKAFPNDWQNIYTIEDFNARVATLGVDLNAYNEGEVIHCNTESIKSVGDNAWDEEWELGAYSSANGNKQNVTNYFRSKNRIKILPNTDYYFACPSSYSAYARFCFYDEQGNFINYVGASAYLNKTFKTPSNAYYMVFWTGDSMTTPTYNNDICIRLAHTGYKTDYEPYWQDTLPLSIIRKYFPDGMKSAGSAHDEIRFNKASGKWEYSKGKIKSVDLGTLDWHYAESEGMLYTFDDRFYANQPLICSRYINRPGYDKDGNMYAVKGILRIFDSSYTDAASFKAEMAGVILYYEAADWEWVELDAEDQNFRDYYNVADFGTEMSQSNVPSAPFSADIIYQFNAVDMIREHEIEITELQKVIATMQAQLTSLINGGQ